MLEFLEDESVRVDGAAKAPESGLVVRMYDVDPALAKRRLGTSRWQAQSAGRGTRQETEEAMLMAFPIPHLQKMQSANDLSESAIT